MDTMKPDQKKQQPQIAPDEERVYALHFAESMSLPFMGVNGGTRKLVATDSRTIVRRKDKWLVITETYRDKRPTMIVEVPPAMAMVQMTPDPKAS